MEGVAINFVLAGKSDADLALSSAPADERKRYSANASVVIAIVQQDVEIHNQ